MSIEDQIRITFGEMAAEAAPAPLLQRLEHTGPAPSRNRVVMAAAAVVVVVAVVAASIIGLRADRGSIVEPTVDPPKVLHFSGDESAAPGRGALLVVLADVVAASDLVHEKPAYVLPTGSVEATLLQESDTDPTWTEHLSADGTRVIREVNSRRGGLVADSRWLEIVDLRSGTVEKVRDGSAFCPALSPDNRMIAGNRDGDVVIIDVRTGRERMVNQAVEYCGGIAWTPDSARLVVRGENGSLLVDRRGRPEERIPGMYPVNGSMSWSPDGRRILLYDADRGRYVSRDVAARSDENLSRPPGGLKPLGWAGTRIVWLAGDVGDQRLTTTDGQGTDARLWIRLETGGMPVESVSWSTPLRGSARD